MVRWTVTRPRRCPVRPTRFHHLALAWMALALLSPPASAELRLGEIGFSGGLLHPDADVIGEGPGAADFELAGGGYAMLSASPRWGFVGQVDNAGISTAQPWKNTWSLTTRATARRFFGEPGRPRFFAEAGIGWWRLHLSRDRPVVDRPLLTVGVGAVFPVSRELSFHWLARIDATRADDGDPIEHPVEQASLLVGLTFVFPQAPDEDGDGVPDDRDACPDTPPLAVVDASGCPRDSDLDGVPDGMDLCPDTPRQIPVDADGCSVTADADGDGVPDGLDRCPGTKPEVRVDLWGCPLEAGIQEIERVVLRNVLFQAASVRLDSSAQASLEAVARALRERPELRIEIGGHADSFEENPDDLSRRRAQSVRAYLIAHGVPEDQLEVRSHGDGDAAEDGSTARGRAANRRVEMKVLEE